MAEPILSYELKALIDKIKQEYVVEFPIQTITPNYLVLAILEEKSCDGYNIISKLMMDSTIDEFRQYIIDRIMIDCAESIKQGDNSTFSDIYEDYADEIANSGASLVTSSLMLHTIIIHDTELVRKLTELGVTPDQINETVIAYNSTSNVVNKLNKWSRKKPKAKDDVAETKPDTQNNAVIQIMKPNTRVIPNENNIVESNCTNMVRLASMGMYDHLIGFDDVITRIFDTFGKYNRNTVAIVGPHGVGKTAVVERLAKVLYDQKCPKMFKDKYVMKFSDTIVGLVIKEMAKLGKYIAFIDNTERMFMNKENEQNNVIFLSELFNTQNVYTIFAITDTAYAKYIASKPELERLVQRINIDVPNDGLLNEIIDNGIKKFEDYNKIVFDKECIPESIRLAKRFVTAECCPASALNILDAAGSYVKMREGENEEIIQLQQKLNDVIIEKNSISNSGSAEDFDRKDMLIREEIDLNKKISMVENKLMNQPSQLMVNITDVKSAVSEMLNIPISEMDDDEKTKLKRLGDNLRAVVIGQDEAVEDITKAVKRQRVGLSNPNKPVVMLFVGTTGVGKCVCGDTVVKIRNKKTNEIQEVTLSELKNLRLTPKN